MTQVGLKAVMSWSISSDIMTYKSWHRSSVELTKRIHLDQTAKKDELCNGIVLQRTSIISYLFLIGKENN